ncbi:MAG: hypothetical protein AAFY11_11865 [Cyanobacteria bacterium J06641_5]
MQLNCETCGTPIPAENINLDRAIAKCTQCNSIFSFADRFPAAVPPKLKVDRPENIRVTRSTNELTIVRKWFGPIFFFFAFFAVFWNGITWTIALAAIFSQEYQMLVFMSLHLAVGLGVLYYTTTLLVNSTEIRVDRRYLSVRNIPLPFPGNCTVPVGRIEQIYCKEKISRGRSRSVTYELYAIAGEDRRQDIIKGLPSAEEAVFLEQEIERFLRIEDRPVRGEYTP